MPYNCKDNKPSSFTWQEFEDLIGIATYFCETSDDNEIEFINDMAKMLQNDESLPTEGQIAKLRAIKAYIKKEYPQELEEYENDE